MAESTHPPPDTLIAYGQGRLSNAESDSVELHLAECDTCQIHIDSAPDDLLVQLVKTALPAEPVVSGSSATTRAEYHNLTFFAKGGLGEVLLARDAIVGRDVAVKRLLPHSASDPNRRKRFLREAAVTGRLEHPGVAPVYGIGEDEAGQPCYTMRFVPGKTLHDLIRELHAAGPVTPGALRHVLSRFVSLCSTAAYAHSRGVIHRDIKPANVAVGAFGETILLDWGLAQTDGDFPADSSPLFDDKANVFGRFHTETGTVMGTPGFMAPEQKAGEQVGATADVYSLGATLKVILTGRNPGEVSPRKTQFAPLHRIVRRAMAENPRARYGSAAGLADEVERWLADEPVSAYPDPLVVRLRRSVRRHQTVAVSAVALLLTTTIALAVGAALLDREQQKTAAALAQRSEALTSESRQREKAENAELAVVAEFRASTDDILGHLLGTNVSFGPAERAFLNNLLERWQKFADRQSDDERGRELRAEAQHRVGRLWRQLGHLPEARTAFGAARDGYESLLRQHPGSASIGVDLASTCTSQATVFRELDAYDQARSACSRALELLNAAAAETNLTAPRRALGVAHCAMGVILQNQGQLEKAVTEYEISHDLHQALVVAESTSSSHRQDLADVDYNLGNALVKLHSFDRADAAFVTAEQTYRQLAAAGLNAHEFRLKLARTYNSMGFLAFQRSQPEVAISKLRLSIATFQQLAADYPSIPSYLTELAKSYTNLGLCLRAMQKSSDARAEYEAARETLRKVTERFPGVPAHRNQFARACAGLGELLNSMGLLADALAQHQTAAAEYRRLAISHPEVAEYSQELANSAVGCADIIRIGRKPNESLIWYNESIQAAKTAHALNPRKERIQLILGIGYVGRAQAFEQMGRVEDANRDWESVLQLCTTTQRREVCATRALARARAGRFESALAEAEELTKTKPMDVNIWYKLAGCYALASAGSPSQNQTAGNKAVELLGASIRAGYRDAAQIANDADLTSLRQRADFQQLVAQLEKHANH